MITFIKATPGFMLFCSSGHPCDGTPKEGICNVTIERWYSQSQSCYVYNYNGCNGQGNNFPTQQACMRACSQSYALAAAVSHDITVNELFNLSAQVDIFSNRILVDTSTILPDTSESYVDTDSNKLVLNRTRLVCTFCSSRSRDRL